MRMTCVSLCVCSGKVGSHKLTHFYIFKCVEAEFKGTHKYLFNNFYKFEDWTCFMTSFGYFLSQCFFCKNLKFMELNWMSNSTRYPLYKKRFFFRPQIQNLCAIWLCGRIHSFSWRVQKKRHENVFFIASLQKWPKKGKFIACR